MGATALPPLVSKVMVYEFAVHLAVRVMPFVTGAVKLYSFPSVQSSSVYHPPKVRPFTFGSSGLTAFSPAWTICVA